MVSELWMHNWFLWVVTPLDLRPVNWPGSYYSIHQDHNSILRQWRPFANDNKANDHKSWQWMPLLFLPVKVFVPADFLYKVSS